MSQPAALAPRAQISTDTTSKPAKRERQPLDLVPILALGLPILVGVAALRLAACMLRCGPLDARCASARLDA